MTRLYLLSWDNGQSYEDAQTTLLGVYLTPEGREAAKARYARLHGRQWPFSEACGEYVEEDIQADEDLIQTHPSLR